MPLNEFTRSNPLTVGIELELQIISQTTYDLSQNASRLVNAIKIPTEQGEVKHDITESILEVTTGICSNINQALLQLHSIRSTILQTANSYNLSICGGGTHPFQKWTDQKVSNKPRPKQAHKTFGYLAKQAAVFGQHVHLGCENENDAIYLLHGLSRFVPHLIAISASSPYIESNDSNYASSRLNMLSSFPSSGPAPFFNCWDEFKYTYEHLESSGMVQSTKDLLWDIRPCPHFGTIEVRVMDTPLTISRAINITGFIQALACWLLSERPFRLAHTGLYPLYRWNRFQACRFGLAGILTDIDTGQQRVISEDTLSLLDIIAPYATQLNNDMALESIYDYIHNNNNDITLIRQFIDNGGLFKELVHNNCELWLSA